MKQSDHPTRRFIILPATVENIFKILFIALPPRWKSFEGTLHLFALRAHCAHVPKKHSVGFLSIVNTQQAPHKLTFFHAPLNPGACPIFPLPPPKAPTHIPTGPPIQVEIFFFHQLLFSTPLSWHHPIFSTKKTHTQAEIFVSAVITNPSPLPHTTRYNNEYPAQSTISVPLDIVYRRIHIPLSFSTYQKPPKGGVGFAWKNYSVPPSCYYPDFKVP